MDNNKIHKRMKIQAAMYDINNYDKNKYIKNDENIAKLINAELYKMEYCEKVCILKKILTDEKINRELLKYELKNYIPEKKVKNYKQLIITIREILNRYHKKAGGNLLEDDEWVLHQKGSNKYDLRTNEAIFENSIHDSNRDCPKTRNFIYEIVKILEKMSDKHKIKFKYLPDPSERIYWVIIKVSPILKNKQIKKKVT